MAPKATHYLFIFPDGAFLSRVQALVGKNRSQLLLYPSSPEAMGSESPEAHITVLRRGLQPVSGSTSAFPTPGRLGGARVALPAVVANDKRSQSPSVALKWTLSAPDRERLGLTADRGVFWSRASSEAQRSPCGPSCIFFVPMLKS